MSATGIAIRGLSKLFSTRDGEVRALENINLDIAPGSFVCLAGPTGCGKTTLLRIIAGLESPTAGGVTIGNRPVDGPRPDAGMVFQQYALFPWRNVLDNVAFGLEMRGVPRQERRERARELIELVGLTRFAHSRTWELSGGMQQRVAIARSLATDPALLLMDEPFGALDERTRHRLQDELLAVWRRTGTTVVFVTHNIDEAVYLGERVLVLADRPSRIAGDFRVDLPHSRDRIAPGYVRVLLDIRAVLEEITRPGETEESANQEGDRDEEKPASPGSACCVR
ncbi:MAG TPA: ABC transporter ATP-binding protein [candidate division WOR-3 bacterium]|uniref:ABC transporter ATP-binding protein n=1 Tax=candidate division WOR-3 bacterium TaxID=2052148 RepID=A0A7V0XG98_UNCW3|nr:ABC transporter ATP-binding protein [candidate division WOR-3 bacterium]